MVSPDTLTPALLSTTYFGPIQWYQKLHRHKPCLIERHESFIKQTYRNRMVIATANGAQTLSIPVTHDDSMLITDIRISDHANWRHVHWNALASAYGESAFFEYYQDDIRPFFEQKWEFLYDFNEAIMYKMIELLDLRVDVGATEAISKQKLTIMPMLSVIIVSLYVRRSRCLMRISVLSVIIRSMPSGMDLFPI